MKLIVSDTQLLTVSASSHRTILALSAFPVGSYINGAELMICVVPGGKSLSVITVLQPFLFVKSDENRGWNVPVVLSVTNRATNSKGAVPVFVTWKSIHQPSSGQLSSPL